MTEQEEHNVRQAAPAIGEAAGLRVKYKSVREAADFGDGEDKAGQAQGHQPETAMDRRDHAGDQEQGHHQPDKHDK